MTVYEFIYNVTCNTCSETIDMTFGVSDNDTPLGLIQCDVCETDYTINQIRKKTIIDGVVDSDIIL